MKGGGKAAAIEDGERQPQAPLPTLPTAATEDVVAMEQDDEQSVHTAREHHSDGRRWPPTGGGGRGGIDAA